MCKEVEKVLKEKTEAPTSCSVMMDGEQVTSDDFVAILVRENGDTGIFYNTDAITLGMAARMTFNAFMKCLHELPENEREVVRETLGNAFTFEPSEGEQHA